MRTDARRVRAGKSGILSVHASAVDSKKIFFRGAGKQHWVTFDEGDHYMPLEPSFTIKELKMHPTESGASATLAIQRPSPLPHTPLSPPTPLACRQPYRQCTLTSLRTHAHATTRLEQTG